jgi:hypothetical protein
MVLPPHLVSGELHMETLILSTATRLALQWKDSSKIKAGPLLLFSFYYVLVCSCINV